MHSIKFISERIYPNWLLTYPYSVLLEGGKDFFKLENLPCNFYAYFYSTMIQFFMKFIMFPYNFEYGSAALPLHTANKVTNK